jgi:DNA polymerase III delta prime subunit
MSHYNEDLEYINEIVNLLEVNNFLPPKLTERARNRCQINRFKRLIDTENNTEVREQIQIKLKECLDKEIKYQKIFSKFNKTKFIMRLIRKLRE